MDRLTFAAVVVVVVPSQLMVLACMFWIRARVARYESITYGAQVDTTAATGEPPDYRFLYDLCRRTTDFEPGLFRPLSPDASVAETRDAYHKIRAAELAERQKLRAGSNTPVWTLPSPHAPVGRGETIPHSHSPIIDTVVAIATILIKILG